MISTFYPPYSFGGDAIYLYRLSNELARRGHFVDVICDSNAYYLLAQNGRIGSFPNHPNVTLHALKHPAGFFSVLATQQTGIPFFKRKYIREMTEKNHYDVIHYHNMSLIGLGAMQYGNAIKLYTMHEHWLVCPMHVLWKYNREVCASKSCISCQIWGKRPPQLWRYTGSMDRAFPYVDAFISPSRFTMRKHQELGFRPPIVHLPYFLPKAKEDEIPAQGDSDATPYFLFVGRLEKIKGLQTVIPVFKKHPEFQLLVAGEGNYENELKKMAKGASNIVFLGKLDHKKLQDLYTRAIAVIVPSICYEVFGIIMIEAFAVKTPVIVRNLGALPEVVEESCGGLIYDNDDQLVEGLKKMSENPELRTELGSNGYKAYRNYWDEESHLRQYFNLIERLETNRRPLERNVV